ncbi:unnamed protein product [Somion occarium]|uniref:Uncharacterized protein n=1 Tax=Somion occarium TaxID=3059160 RepID=A0ABP1E502_9APHY
MASTEPISSMSATTSRHFPMRLSQRTSSSRERRARRDYADNWPFPKPRSRELRRTHSKDIPLSSSHPNRRRTLRRKQGVLHLREIFKRGAMEIQMMELKLQP